MINIITENIIIALEMSAHPSQPTLNEHRQTHTTTFTEYITSIIGAIKSGMYTNLTRLKITTQKIHSPIAAISQ